LLLGEPGRSARVFGFSAAGVEPVADVVRARTVLQRLKPDSSSSDCGTAKQLTEKVALRRKTIPQRLKPDSFCLLYGTAEQLAEKSASFKGAHFQLCHNNRRMSPALAAGGWFSSPSGLFPQSVKPCPFKTVHFSAICKAMPLQNTVFIRQYSPSNVAAGG
jgi:hypothetical protein